MIIKTNNANGAVRRKIEGRPETGMLDVKIEAPEMRDFHSRLRVKSKVKLSKSEKRLLQSLKRDVTAWLREHTDEVVVTREIAKLPRVTETLIADGKVSTVQDIVS